MYRKNLSKPKILYQFAALLLACTMVFALAACARSSSTPPASSSEPAKQPGAKFTPGTYTGTGAGFGGAFDVNVTVDETSITDIEIGENHETDGIGTTALELIPEWIKAGQTVRVDFVSGCTVTSAAIMTAATAALEQSGVDMALVTKPYSPEKVTGNETLETDVLVIGGGGSGILAAIAAREQGAEVLLVEKMSFVGGAAAISGGMVGAAGSEYQKARGVTDDSPEIFASDLMRGGNQLNDPMLVKLYSENVGAMFDWIVGLGVEFADDFSTSPEHSKPRYFLGSGGAAGLNKSMKAALDRSGAAVMLDTKVTALVQQDGAITGAKAEGRDGKTYDINAKSVILCTGGYGYNEDLLTDALKEVMYYGPVSATGDGILMARELGAVTRMMEYGKIYPNGIQIGGPIGRSTIFANNGAFAKGGILVDRSGSRVVNETGTQSGIRDALDAQDDKTLFLVMDQKAFDEFYQLGLVHKYFNEDEVARWLEKNGEGMPVFANGATLQEAAAAAGLDAAGLKKTLEAYNDMVQAGEDTLFGRTITEGLEEGGRFYIVEQKRRFATTLGGLQITENMEVVHENGEIIPGLLAAGEIVGGVHGNDTIISGAVSWAYTSGKLAGTQAGKMAAQ